MNWVTTAAYIIVLLYLAYTDLSERRIPNFVVLTAAGVALFEAVVVGSWFIDILGGLVGASLFLLPRYLYGPAMAGAADVKLALFLGLWLGYPTIIGAILFAALAVSVLALVSWLRGNYTRKATVPMAPFLALGTFIMLALAGV